MSSIFFTPDVLLTTLIGSFSALVAITAFHSFVLVHWNNISSGYYREFASFFGKGACIPIIMLYAFAILMTSMEIVGFDYEILPIVSLSRYVRPLCLLILGTGWYFVVFGIVLITIKYLREHLVIEVYFQ